MLWKKTGVKGESDAISVFKWWPGEFLLNHDMAEPLRSIPCQERGCKGLQRKQGGWKERKGDRLGSPGHTDLCFHPVTWQTYLWFIVKRSNINLPKFLNNLKE